VERIASSITNRLTLGLEDDNEILANKFQEDVKMYNAQLKGLRNVFAPQSAFVRVRFSAEERDFHGAESLAGSNRASARCHHW